MRENLVFLRILCVININMRCIEIALNAWVDSNYNMININMRCIEINFYPFPPYRPYRININMRCIEM